MSATALQHETIFQRLFALSGQVALVTGSARGIGLALARGLAEAGAHVVLNDIRADRLAAAERALDDDGLAVSSRLFDITDAVAIRRAVDGIVADHGHLDILVNNAAIQDRQAITDYSAEQWSAVVDTDLNGPFKVAQAAARQMLAQGHGRIINIASILGSFGRHDVGAYVSAKSGLLGLTRVLAAELGPHGATANAIAPGYIRTELNDSLFGEPAFADWLRGRTPVPRFGTADDLVGALLYLASPAAAFVNGHVLTVDGGMTAVL